MTGDPKAPDVSAARALAAIGIEEHEPIEVDGFQVARTLRPRSPEELGQQLSQLTGSGLGILVCGGSSALQFGNPPRRADLFLSTLGIAGVDEFDEEDGVVHVRAGTTLKALRQVVETTGWEVPLDPPGRGSTIGGILARAAAGPRELAYGPPRRAVLGMDVVLASGMLTHCGGRVVKNVTGFDLAKLYTGSFGSLGVIVGCWLRLRPRPESVRVLRVEARHRDAMLSLARRAARRVTARAVGVLCPGAVAEQAGAKQPRAWQLVIEWAGEERAVARDAAWLQEEGSDAQACEEGIQGLRDLQGRVLEPGGVRARLSMLPSRLGRASEKLSGPAGAQLLYPGQGSLYAYAGPGASRALSDACRALVGEADAKRHAASLRFEALACQAKEHGDVFQEPGPEGRILRALKQRFDPEALLNPGRFQGGL